MIRWMVDGVVELMVEWGDWVDGGVGWLSGWWGVMVERMMEWNG